MKLTLINSQRRHRLALPAVRKLIQDVIARARARDREHAPWREVVAHLVDDRGIEAVNIAVLNHAGPTDVITQRYLPCPGEPCGLIGEIFVNVEQAWRVSSRRKNWSPDRELALYLAHGVDHLSGADDHTAADRARMRRRELRWLRQTTLTPLFRTTTLGILQSGDWRKK